MRRALLVAAILAVGLGTARCQENKAKAVDLTGRWRVVSTEESGKLLPKSQWVQSEWVFVGHTATVRSGIDSQQYHFTTDDAKSPSHLTLQAANPRFGFTCIYKVKRDRLDGDTMTICWNAGGQAARPAEFKTGLDDSYTLITLRRDP